MSQDFAIQAENITKKYDDITALGGTSFTVKSGEIFGLLGPNGAGKTTLISILTGLKKPDAGKFSIFGTEFYEKNNKNLKKLIGIIPQSLALYSNLTAKENLEFFGGLYGLKGKHLKQRIETVLEIAGLTDRAKNVVSTFSGGMQRRLNLAIGLIHEPQVVFLDEPTVGVDPQSRNSILETIKRLNQEQGLTVIYTTHYMEEAQKLCHRIAIIDKGQIIAMDTPDALCHMLGEGFFRAALDNSDNLDRLLSLLRTDPNVREVTWKTGLLEVNTNVLQAAVIGFMNLSNQHGIRVSSLNIFEANLETVFLKLTGNMLRDR